MLKSVLDLDEVTVGDIKMHRSKVVSLNANTPIAEVIQFVTKTPYSRIPVYQGRRDNIVGILHTKAVMQMMPLFYGHRHRLSLLDYCTKPWFVLNTTSLLDQLIAFKKRREHFAVIDKKLVWHGGMNLLGKADAWDNLIRVESEQAAAELLVMAEEGVGK